VNTAKDLRIPSNKTFLDQSSVYQLLKKDSVPCSYSLVKIKLHCRHSDQL
jgi:hypothetical protein